MASDSRVALIAPAKRFKASTSLGKCIETLLEPKLAKVGVQIGAILRAKTRKIVTEEVPECAGGANGASER